MCDINFGELNQATLRDWQRPKSNIIQAGLGYARIKMNIEATIWRWRHIGERKR